MRTLFESTSRVLSKLDDPRGLEYSRPLVGQFLQDGYDTALRKVEALFDVHYPELVVATQTYDLPEGTVKVDRATYDFRQLDPEYKRYMREVEGVFQTSTSDPQRYVIDADGLNTIRFIGAPQEAMTTYTVTGTRGALKQVTSTEFNSESVTGTRGILRQTSSHLWIGTQFGSAKRLYDDEQSARVEYFRLGRQLSEYEPFEVPDRFVKVIEFWALAKCLEREGPGQDVALSKHYRARFDSGVERLRSRINSVHKIRVGSIGGSPASARPPYAQLDPNHFERN
jgi:hypothetical protein